MTDGPSCSAAGAQSAAAAKVYLDYTQAELDRAYDQRAWVSNAEDILKRYAAESAKVRARLEHRYGVRYGPSDDETLDIFPPAPSTSAAPSPIHVHVHGGAWRLLGKDDVSFLAPTFVSAGAIYIALNFSKIPAVRLPDMIAQARRAIAWIHANAAQFDGDPARIHVSGQSSGSHMAGVLVTTDWAGLGLPADVIKSGLLISGMYDLRPVMMSARSAYVKLSAAEILDLSAILHIDRLRVPIVVVYGSRETPEFQRQPASFVDAVRSAGKQAKLLRLEGVNHFELLSVLADAKTPLAHAALELMGLRPSLHENGAP